MTTKHTAFLLGSGEFQFDIFKQLKSRDLLVVVCGPSLKFQISRDDIFLECDVMDFKKIFEFGKQFSKKFAISSQTDITSEIVSMLNQEWGIYYTKPDEVIFFSNKTFLRERVKKINNDFNPDFYSTFDNIKSTYEYISSNICEHKTLVVKPAKSQSSRGVFKIDEHNYNAIFNNMELFRKDYENAGLILESELIGDEITIEGYKTISGDHHSLAISKKKKLKFGIANRLIYDFDISNEYSDVIKFNNDLYQNLEYGPTHSEYILTKSGFKLVEAAARTGGTHIPSYILINHIGISLESKLIDDILNPNLTINDFKRTKVNNIVALCFYNQSGVMTKEPLDINKNVIFSKINVPIGTEPHDVTDDKSRHGFFIIGSPSHEELGETINNITEKINNNYMQTGGILF